MHRLEVEENGQVRILFELLDYVKGEYNNEDRCSGCDSCDCHDNISIMDND